MRSLATQPATTTRPTVFKRSIDRKSTRLNSSHSQISYAVFCLKKKKKQNIEGKRRYEVQQSLMTHGVEFAVVRSLLALGSARCPYVRCVVILNHYLHVYHGLQH